MGQAWPLFVYFRSFQTQILQKNGPTLASFCIFSFFSNTNFTVKWTNPGLFFFINVLFKHNFYGKMGQPWPLFAYVRTFHTQILQKKLYTSASFELRSSE